MKLRKNSEMTRGRGNLNVLLLATGAILGILSAILAVSAELNATKDMALEADATCEP